MAALSSPTALGESSSLVHPPTQHLTPDESGSHHIESIDTYKRLNLLILPSLLWQQRASRRLVAARSNMLGSTRGALKGFVDLPLDVVFETAMYLHPGDLLALSRLSKQLRATFMSRSAASVWREVMRAIPGLPSCPRDMTGPQYASYVFDTHCMACGSPAPGVITYPILRLRLCVGCSGLNIIGGRSWDRERRQDIAYEDKEILELLSIIPNSDWLYRPPHELELYMALDLFYFKPEADILMQEYNAAKQQGRLEAFITARRAIKQKMIDEGKAMAPCIDTKILGSNQYSRRSCCVKIYPRPSVKSRP